MYIGLQRYSSSRSQQQGKGNEEIMRQRAREREAQMYVVRRFWRGTRKREAPRSFGVGTLDRLRTKEFTHKSAREPETPKIYNCCRFKKHGQENRRRHTDRQTKREREREIPTSCHNLRIVASTLMIAFPQQRHESLLAWYVSSPLISTHILPSSLSL